MNMKKMVVAMSLLTPLGFSQGSFAAQLEEIVVTAQRKSESIQDVPIAIIAASQEQLDQASILSINDLNMISPAVTVADSFGYVFPFVRGIGSFIPGPTNDSSVAVYVDGVKKARLQSSALELDNIEQIEILKGPQATLYGRNATGGTLKITTKTPQPGDELNGSVSATVGDYDHRRATFYIAGGLTDTLAASISGNYAKRDGFIENLAPVNRNAHDILFENKPNAVANGDDLDSLDTFYVSAKLNWQPTEDLQFVLQGFYTEKDDTAGTPLRQFNPNAAATLAFFTGAPAEAFEFGGEHKTYGHSNINIYEGKGAQLNISYIWNDLSFSSVSAFNKQESLNSTDLFGANFAVAGFNGVMFNEDFSQEFQLTEDDGEGLDWTIGASYFKEEANGGDFVATIGIAGGFPSDASTSIGEYFIESKSVFAEVYYSLTDRLSLTAGLRYVEEEAGVTPIKSPLPIEIGHEFTTSSDATPFRLVLDYEYDWGMVYASFSEGFKSGGIIPATPTNSYAPEELRSYEIGFKSTILDGGARLNGAVFLYDFTSIQALVVGGPTGGSSFAITGDQADLSGMELEFEGLLTDRLSIQAGVTVLFEKEYSDFDFPGQGVNGDLDFIPPFFASGNDIAGAADFVGLVGVQYQVPLESGSLTFAGNANYNSGHFLVLTNNLGSGGLSDDSFTVVNSRITYLSADENWEVALWAKNLTDEYYIRGGIVAVGNAAIGGLEAPPRHYGITAKYSF